MVKETIRSVRRQGYGRYQHLLVDDGSTDATPATLEAAAADPHIAVVTLPENRGQSAAANAALERLDEFDYITVIHSDDLLLLESLAQRIAFAQEERHDFVYTDLIHLTVKRTYKEVGINPSPTILRKMRFGKELAYPSMLWSTALFATIGGYDPAIRSAEDREIAMRTIAALGNTGYGVLHEPTVLVRHYPGSLHSQNLQNGEKARSYERILERHYPPKEQRLGRLFLDAKLLPENERETFLMANVTHPDVEEVSRMLSQPRIEKAETHSADYWLERALG
jgi:glycosyltransferase involved in cell wall biosynthesis